MNKMNLVDLVYLSNNTFRTISSILQNIGIADSVTADLSIIRDVKSPPG